MNKISKAFIETVKNLDFNKIIIGYSGGVDSQVLLHALSELQPIYQIKAMHVHHGISKNADQWLEFCKTECEALGIEFEHLELNLGKDVSNIEEVARDKRYDFFKKEVDKNTLVLTAHHADDQAETILHNLFRGSGLSGLVGIREIQNFGEGFIVRPLLSFSKEDLKEYAVQENLSWVEDESNADSKYTRNFIRNELMPLVKEKWPNVSKNIQNASTILSETEDYILTELNLKYSKVIQSKSLDINSLPKKKFELNHVIREWFKNQTTKYPEKKILESLKNIIFAKEDKIATLEYKNFYYYRYKGTIERLSKDFDFKIEYEKSKDSKGLLINPEKLQIKERVLGEKIYMNNMNVSVKKLLAEFPVLLRAKVPFFYDKDVLVSIGGVYNNQHYVGEAKDIYSIKITLEENRNKKNTKEIKKSFKPH